MSVLALLLVALIPFTLNAVLPSCYHSYDEISSILFDLENQHPDIAKVHLIGYSQQDEEMRNHENTTQRRMPIRLHAHIPLRRRTHHHQYQLGHGKLPDH